MSTEFDRAVAAVEDYVIATLTALQRDPTPVERITLEAALVEGNRALRILRKGA